MDPMEMIGPELAQLISNLKRRLDEEIKKYDCKAFIRLNSRSPKDAVLNAKKTSELLYHSMLDNWNNPPENDQIVYWQCIYNAMCVTSGDDAVRLLLNSNRIFEDLSRGDLAQGQDNYNTFVVLRRWAEIDPECEFRAFISGDKMTAITQYHNTCFVPSFAENKDLIQNKIYNKWEEVKHLIDAPNGNYTIDFVFHNNFSDIYLIEINDPPPIAGTSLFNYNNENDKKLLSEGPLSLRILENPIPWEKQEIHPPLKILIEETREKFKIQDKENKCIIS